MSASVLKLQSLQLLIFFEFFYFLFKETKFATMNIFRNCLFSF